VPKSWEKRDSETPASYEKFNAFLTLEPSKRTMKDCAKLCNCSLTSIGELARRHDWQKRATAFDAHHREIAIAPTFNKRLKQQKEFLEASRGIGSSLLRMGLDALRELERNAEEPLPPGVALKAVEIGHRLYSVGVGADQPRSDVENAIATLADGGYLPSELLEQIMENVEEMRGKNKALFKSQTENRTLLEPADDEPE